jgi:hypothetical protein
MRREKSLEPNAKYGESNELGYSLTMSPMFRDDLRLTAAISSWVRLDLKLLGTTRSIRRKLKA